MSFLVEHGNVHYDRSDLNTGIAKKNTVLTEHYKVFILLTRTLTRENTP